jgi:argininosuccinate lyase
LLATDLADHLVRRGVPFRQAHHAVGAVVALAEKAGKPLDKVTLEEFLAADPRFGPDVHGTFDLDGAMSRRELPGAPGTRAVAREIARWRKALA